MEEMKKTCLPLILSLDGVVLWHQQPSITNCIDFGWEYSATRDWPTILMHVAYFHFYIISASKQKREEGRNASERCTYLDTQEKAQDIQKKNKQVKNKQNIKKIHEGNFFIKFHNTVRK